MFRPYTLTSLVAWTGGALAGNQAYYKHKQAPFDAGARTRRLLPETRAYVRKLAAIQRQFLSLVRSLSGAATRQLPDGWKKTNITPFIHLIFYDDWLQENLERIKSQMEQAGVITEPPNWLDLAAQHIHASTISLRKVFESMFSQLSDPALRRALEDSIAEKRSFCWVEESSFKLVTLNKEKLFIYHR